MGGEADAHAGLAYRLQLREVIGGRLLPRALEPAARVSGKQQHELDPRVRGRLDRGVGLGQPEVVELAHGRVARGEHLAVDVEVVQPDLFGRQSLGQAQHGHSPLPEVRALCPSAQRPLEGVAVGVHESRQAERLRHPRILSAWRRAQFRLLWP